MSQDERTGPESPRERGADWPDEGLIHEWLDGQLDASASAELEALVTSSPAFAARVAEARGLTAASTRILQSLDAIPGAVLPKAAGVTSGTRAGMPAGTRAGTPARSVAPAARARSGWPWTRIGSIAALLMVGVTGVAVLQREPAATSPLDMVVMASDSVGGRALVGASASDQAVAEQAVAEQAAAGTAATDQVAAGTAAGERSAAAQATAARAAPTVASAAVPAEPPATSPATPRNAPAPPPPAASARSVVERSVAGGVATAAPQPPSADTRRAVANALTAERERSASPTAAKAAAAQAGSSQAATARRAPEAAAGLAAAPRLGAAADAAGASMMMSASPFAEVVSDVRPEELLLAVQRVLCTPSCRQLRVEVARDGRIRRWVQTGFLAGAPETGRVDEADVTRLERLVDSLELAKLPATLQLDGGRCRSVGALRESLRLEFVQDGAVRTVMGLPWCTDGTHAMDHAAAAAEALANGLFGAP